ASRTDEGHQRSTSWRGDGRGSLVVGPTQVARWDVEPIHGEPSRFTGLFASIDLPIGASRRRPRNTSCDRFPPQSDDNSCGTCSGRRKPSRVWSISNCKIEGISPGKGACCAGPPGKLPIRRTARLRWIQDATLPRQTTVALCAILPRVSYLPPVS